MSLSNLQANKCPQKCHFRLNHSIKENIGIFESAFLCPTVFPFLTVDAILLSWWAIFAVEKLLGCLGNLRPLVRRWLNPPSYTRGNHPNDFITSGIFSLHFTPLSLRNHGTFHWDPHFWVFKKPLYLSSHPLNNPLTLYQPKVWKTLFIKQLSFSSMTFVWRIIWTIYQITFCFLLLLRSLNPVLETFSNLGPFLLAIGSFSIIPRLLRLYQGAVCSASSIPNPARKRSLSCNVFQLAGTQHSASLWLLKFSRSQIQMLRKSDRFWM